MDAAPHEVEDGVSVSSEASCVVVLDPGPKHKYYMCAYCRDNKLLWSIASVKNHLMGCENFKNERLRHTVWPSKLKQKQKAAEQAAKVANGEAGEGISFVHLH